MARSVPKALFEGEAYRLFYQEFQQRLDELTRCLNGDANVPHPGELSARFHMLKGGSGFFGFDEICRVAGQLEKLFADQSKAPCDLGVIRQAHQVLESQRGDMPAPIGSTHA